MFTKGFLEWCIWVEIIICRKINTGEGLASNSKSGWIMDGINMCRLVTFAQPTSEPTQCDANFEFMCCT